MQYIDKPTMTAELAIAECKRCGNIGASMNFVRDKSPHFARMDCQNCGAFIDWISHPESKTKNRRRKSRKKLRDRADRCEICLRHRNQLPADETLEVHHVLEVAADNGTDDPANLRPYCTGCHSLVNWARTYFGHYTTERDTEHATAEPASGGRARPEANSAQQAS